MLDNVQQPYEETGNLEFMVFSFGIINRILKLEYNHLSVLASMKSFDLNYLSLLSSNLQCKQ